MESSLLDELKAKSDHLTGTLRRVTDDMKTKNRSDRSSVVEAKERAKSYEKPLSCSASITCSKETWLVKGFDAPSGIVALPSGSSSMDDSVPSAASMKQTVCIMDCRSATFQLQPAKMNSLLIHNCTKTSVIVNSLISSIELCDCTKVKVQVLGVVPCIAIDKSTGIDLYLSAESKNAEITSSKSGEMNVNIPKEPSSDSECPDWVEIAIPEQYVHQINSATNTLSTRVSHLYTS